MTGLVVLRERHWRLLPPLTSSTFSKGKLLRVDFKRVELFVPFPKNFKLLVRGVFVGRGIFSFFD
ncbi:MAG: hypothetical protein AAGA34_04210 [Pseudomonadota bacterium]